MAKPKDITYKRFQAFIKDKDRSVNSLIEEYLTKTQSMFHYDNLPDTIPVEELEHLLQVNGNCFVTKIDGNLYALQGSTGGELDEYYRPTKFIVANPYLKLNKEFEIDKDGVLFKNDYFMNGLLPIIGKYAVLLTDSAISLNTATVLSRITMLISASDDKTKQSAELFLKKITDGEFSVIGENAFFKGVNLQTAPTTNSQYITQLIELYQYYKASLLNDIGLNANYNMKRERLNVNEVALNIDALLPFVDNMLNERVKAVEAINKMFDTDITVMLSSAWKSTHEENDNLVAMVQTESHEEAETFEDIETDDGVIDTDTGNGNDPIEATEAKDETIEKSETETEADSNNDVENDNQDGTDNEPTDKDETDKDKENED